MGNTPNTTGAQTANPVEESAKKPRRKVSAIGSTNESILEFIMARELHECDAIKVAMNIVKSGIKVSNITEHDASILNTFLNDGLKSGANNTVDTVMTHRQHRAYRLAMALGNFLEKKEQITVMSGTLMLFASTTQHANDILSKLNPTVPQTDYNAAGRLHADALQHDKHDADKPQTTVMPNANATAKQ